MNCNLCAAYLREKNRCPGCRECDIGTRKSAYNCVIKNCDKLKENHWKYCSLKCEKFPCRRLKNLDKRYRAKYEMSMIENLEYIEKNGILKFIESEKKRWIRENKIFCVHKKKYYDM